MDERYAPKKIKGWRITPELAWHAELRQRHPDTWLELIRQLPDHVQNAVARIVWWDYFADKQVTEKWPHLDWCLNTFDEPEFEDWQKALQILGYTKESATQRVTRYGGRPMSPGGRPLSALKGGGGKESLQRKFVQRCAGGFEETHE